MRRSLAAAVVVTALAVAGPAAAAEFRVVVVPGLERGDLAALAGRGAVGLLVPDAGPETSAARARAALERGEVRNSLLGSNPAGEPLIQVETAATVPAGRAIVLGLPRGGEQPNDRRYPIAVLGGGYRGLLVSEATRLPGLVSVVDVAPTALDRDDALGWEPEGEPLAALAALEDRIEANRDAKAPVLLVSLALLVALAVFVPAAAVPAFAAVLLANLGLGIARSTEPWVDVLAVVAAVAASLLLVRAGPLALGLVLAGVLGAYLIAMGVDERWVALSPLGPTQNARFYGLSNLLATLLLVPALAGAVLLGRTIGLWAFGAVAALALVTVGGSSFGADGGGALVLLTAFVVLAVLHHGLTRRIAIGAAVVLGVLALGLVAGGTSHVTDALADGPAGLAEDLWRRVQLSFERATGGWGVGLLVFGGVAALATLAVRERRPLLLALLAALGVSLVVNDSPNDVVLGGLACYLALSSAPELARPASERARPAGEEPRAQTAPAASR